MAHQFLQGAPRNSLNPAPRHIILWTNRNMHTINQKWKMARWFQLKRGFTCFNWSRGTVWRLRMQLCTWKSTIKLQNQSCGGIEPLAKLKEKIELQIFKSNRNLEKSFSSIMIIDSGRVYSKVCLQPNLKITL